MSYSIKTGSVSGTGLETTTRFWKNHSSVSMDDMRLKGSGIPLDVRNGNVAFSEPETHCMVCGVSGKGKTRRELYPTVILSARAGRSMVIADMKGEIFRHTATEVSCCGHDIKVINLRTPSKGDRFNPFSLVQSYWDSGDRSRATILLKDICSLVTSKVHSERDKFWEIAAMDAIMGFALLLLDRRAPLTFDNIHCLFNQYFADKDSRSEFNKAFNKVDAEAVRRLATVANLESDVTLSCIVSEVNSSLSCYIDQPDIRDLLSGSDFELTNIGRKPTAIYIICPDESTSLYGIASLFVEQCYSELIRYADEREDNMLPVKVDFLLDEFGAFVGSDWPSKLTAARSRGIRFILAIQSMSQLVARYGENGSRTIMSNCRTLVYMGGRDIRLMSEISALSGYREDPRTGLEKPVLSLNDLMNLKTGEIVVLDDSGLPYIGHVPDWSEWNIRDKARLADKTRRSNPENPVDLKKLLCIQDDAGRKQGEQEYDSGNPDPADDEDPSDEETDRLLRALADEALRDPDSTREAEEFLSRIRNVDDDDELPF